MRIRRPKLSYEYVKNYFASQGCTLLEKRYVSSKSPLSYRCKCGKKQVTCFNNFSRGHRCMMCYMNRFHGKKKELQKLELRSKLYTISDVARMLNVHPEELHREIYLRERLPSPTRKLGVLQRRYYNEGDVRAIFKLVKY